MPAGFAQGAQAAEGYGRAVRKVRETGTSLLGYWPCWLAALLVMSVIKYRYSSVDVEMLRWILTPTAWWAGVLTGDVFTWQAGAGYVSHAYEFVIASTCSGIQFMMIVIAALVFGYVHHMGTLRRGLWWTGGTVGFSYVFTIFVNGVRIACAIFIPRRLPAGLAPMWTGRWLTPERFHTMIGIVVYFTSLLFIYEMAGAGLRRIGILAGGSESWKTGQERGDGEGENPGIWEGREKGVSEKTGFGVPVFWYFFIVLGIPFLNRAYERNREGFTEYTALLVVVCPVVAGIYRVIGKLRRRR